MKWLPIPYPDGEREPLFMRLSSYLLALTALGVALGVQWWVVLNHPKRLWYITGVTIITVHIWGAIGLLIWDLVQLLPLKRATLIRDVFVFALVAALLLWAQQIRFYLFGGFGSPPIDLTYLENAQFFLHREAIFYLAIFAALVLLLRGTYAQKRMQRVQIRSTEMQQEMTRVELLGLRSRLEPHFFFNALNTISSLVRQDPKKAEVTIELLSRIMRRNLDHLDREMTTLGEELSAVREYLDLQKVRFGPRLSYNEVVPPEAIACDVPIQLLQPIVENCITHGVEVSPTVTRIDLRCSQANGDLQIVVTNTRSDDPSQPGLGSGLKSVERRLRLLYQGKATIDAGPAPGEFRVQLTLPITHNGDGKA